MLSQSSLCSDYETQQSVQSPFLTLSGCWQAAGITNPNEIVNKACNDIGGHQALWAVFYDSKGFKYEVPVYCWAEPQNMTVDEPVHEPDAGGLGM